MDLDLNAAVQRLPGLQSLTGEQVHELSRWMVPRALETEQILFHQGATAQSMFLVLRGMLRLEQRDRRGDMQAVGNVRPGEPIGEDALFERAPRALTCIASSSSLVAELSADDLAMLERRAPALASRLIFALCQVQSRRLRRLNQQTEGLIRKYAAPGLLELPKPGGADVTVMGRLWARISRRG